MVHIQQYIDALTAMDAKALSDLFAYDATYRDTCPEVTGQPDLRCHGREGIDMYFRNQFIFRKFSITDPQILNEKEALFVGIYGTFYLVAVASILDYDKDGNIRHLVVRPA